MSKPSQGFVQRNMIPLLLIVAGALLAFTKPIYSKISPAELEVQIAQTPVVMPAMYKVYGNDEALNGKYSLFKMLVKNTSSRVAENVTVSFEMPNFITSTVCKKIAKILPGQTVVVNCHPSLPDKIVEKTTSSKEQVNITVKGPNIKTIEESFPIFVKGRNEFVYTFIPADEIRTAAEGIDNKELLPCLITPEDPIIKYFTQKIQEKILKGEMASVGNQEKEGVRVMMGIYEATLRSHMVYSGTSGVPEKIGDASTLTQSIRLPREVITGKTGLCIELSLLYASVMMCAGMDPIVFLVPGHAYPGFRMNGNLYAIESTGIGGEGMGGRSSAEQALQSGMKSLESFMQHANAGDPAYMYVDVRALIKEGALAMELKDDNFLRQKIDEIALSFENASVPQNVPVVNTGGGGNDGGGGGGGGGNTGGGNDGGGGNTGGGGGGNTGGSSAPSGYSMYSGNDISFAYPSSWRSYPREGWWLPNMVKVIGNSARTMNLQIYSYPGYSSADQAMQNLANQIENKGSNCQYRKSGESNGFTVYSGTTSNGSGGLNWVGAFKRSSNGIIGITVGAQFGTNGEATATKIFNTLQ